MKLLFKVQYKTFLTVFYRIWIVLIFISMLVGTKFFLNKGFSVDIFMQCGLILSCLILAIFFFVITHFSKFYLEVYDTGIKAVYNKGKSVYKNWDEIKRIHYVNSIMTILIGFTTIECNDGTKIRVKPEMSNYKRLIELMREKI